ncbi:hypothetical protein C2U70_20070 [Bradyrhizobium guangdongense]|nr:hypothetical protein C2U70_20070 [Bradyrhizobium guangdongense]
MLALVAWGAYKYQPPISTSVSEVLLIGCGILCLALLMYHNDKTPTGPLFVVVLTTFVIVGSVGAEDVSRLIPFQEPGFIRSHRERWEIVALASTAFMAVIYFDSLDDIKAFLDGKGFQGINFVNICLVLSIALLLSALYEVHSLFYHYMLVLTVTFLFAAIDWHLSRSLSRKASTNGQAQALAEELRAVLFLLDLPVLAALAVLGLFVFTRLGCTGAGMLEAKIPESGTFGQILAQNECVEAYPFLAGSLAFQMLSYNIIYIVFTFRLHLNAGGRTRAQGRA